eukprot:TRINITY_DN7782_c0_g1_i12.p1 TRINITY_DN7782_c0_g1~~TRINITY_DN7782_c0_g1_i12.p1  ORF type:complete len:259 (-),score=37.61 TRINITY_DN7782_c0_g1_i12:262-1038(-)
MPSRGARIHVQAAEKASAASSREECKKASQDETTLSMKVMQAASAVVFAMAGLQGCDNGLGVVFTTLCIVRGASALLSFRPIPQMMPELIVIAFRHIVFMCVLGEFIILGMVWPEDLLIFVGLIFVSMVFHGMCLYTMPFSALAKWLHFCAMLAGSIIAWPIRWRFPVAAAQVSLTVEATGQSMYRLLPFLGFLLLNTLVVWDGAFVPEDGKPAAATELQPKLTSRGPFASMIAEARGRSAANKDICSDVASRTIRSR